MSAQASAAPALAVGSSSAALDEAYRKVTWRLIPFLLDRFVTKVDLDGGCITVDWDPDF